MDETRRGPGEWLIPTGMLAEVRAMRRPDDMPRAPLDPADVGGDALREMTAGPGLVVLMDSPEAREALDAIVAGQPGVVRLNTGSATSLGLAVRGLRGDMGRMLVVDCAAAPAWVDTMLAGPDLSENRVVVIAPEGAQVSTDCLPRARIVRFAPEPVPGPGR